VAVGSDGDTLVADSAASTGLRWQGNYAAGKNLIINGAMDFWQRGTSISGGDAGGSNYLADRWASQLRSTQSRETDVPSNLFKYSLKLVKAFSGGGLPGQFWQGIEPQTFTTTGSYTLSFYAKSSNLTSVVVNVLDRSTAVGEGGTTNATIFTSSSIAITSSWARYSVTFTLSSLSFTGDRIGIYIGNSSAAVNDNLFLTGVQLEVGSVATPFSRAGGTLQGELAACQRYLPVHYVGSATIGILGQATGTGTAYYNAPFLVQPRVVPTGISLSTGTLKAGTSTFGDGGGTGVFNSAQLTQGQIVVTGASGLTAGNASYIYPSATITILWTGCEL
jgi:hypothetical protein